MIKKPNDLGTTDYDNHLAKIRRISGFLSVL